MSRINEKKILKLIEIQKKNMPIEEQFLNDLILSIERTPNDYKSSKTYKPSSMNCERMMVYEVLGCKKDKGYRSAVLDRMGEVGTDRHDKIQEHIKNMNGVSRIDCEYLDVGEYIKKNNLVDLEIKSKVGNETKVYHKKLNMSFMTDGIVRYKDILFIFEYKTEISYKWNRRDYIADEHITQATAYSVAFNINEVIFIYESRDTCQKKVYKITITDEMKRKYILDKIAYCNEFVLRKEIPPKPLHITDKDCNYCNYKEICKSEIG